MSYQIYFQEELDKASFNPMEMSSFFWGGAKKAEQMIEGFKELNAVRELRLPDNYYGFSREQKLRYALSTFSWVQQLKDKKFSFLKRENQELLAYSL